MSFLLEYIDVIIEKIYARFSKKHFKFGDYLLGVIGTKGTVTPSCYNNISEDYSESNFCLTLLMSSNNKCQQNFQPLENRESKKRFKRLWFSGPLIVCQSFSLKHIGASKNCLNRVIARSCTIPIHRRSSFILFKVVNFLPCHWKWTEHFFLNHYFG